MDPSLHPFVNKALIESRQESLRRLALPAPPGSARPHPRRRLGLVLIQFGLWIGGPAASTREVRRPALVH